MWHRTHHWPVALTWTLILVGVGLLIVNPHVLAPVVTQTLNRILLSGTATELNVRAYRVRPQRGVDLYDVSLTVPGFVTPGHTTMQGSRVPPS